MRIAALTVLLLAGCASGQVKVPKIVQVPVDHYVPLDPALTAACKQEPAKNQTLGEAVRLAELRRIWLADCAARMARIKALQPP